MTWAWGNSLDEIWRWPAFPMWLTLAAAGFFGIIVLVTLLRAEKSVANGALTVITLLAVGIAVAATIRSFGSITSGTVDSLPSPPMTASLPALACVDDLAGEAVLNACEKAVFGSPEAVAAALSYAASQITRLNGFGDVASANKNMTPELEALRRAVEQDRYGLMAQVLMVRDHCTPSDCAAFKALTDRRRIMTNMDERTYENLVVHYLPTWNAPPVPAAPAVAALIPGVATGRPTNAEFPSAASTPPVSIMTPEPGTGTTATSSVSKSTTPANAPAPKPPAAPPAVAAAKKPPAPKPRPVAPAPSPSAPSAPAAAAPATSND